MALGLGVRNGRDTIVGQIAGGGRSCPGRESPPRTVRRRLSVSMTIGVLVASFAIAGPVGGEPAAATIPSAGTAAGVELLDPPPTPPGLGTVVSSATPTQRAAGGSVRAASGASGGTALTGVFAVTAGVCSGGAVTSGSYFRMIQPGGTTSGPFVSNSDSPCADKTYTSLSPGTDGGLSTVAYQPNPNPAFDGGGNGTANRIFQPQKFFGVAFAVSTNATDPQSGTAVPVPSVVDNGGALTGDLRAVSVAYNGQHFNQGSPKPDGSKPGITNGPSGSYTPSSGAFVLDWTSTIVGGPFNNFTGVWHLQGKFESSSTGSASPTTTAGSTTGSNGGGTATPTASGGSAGTGAVSSASGGSAASGTLPNTGPSVPAWPGALLLVTGAAGLLLRRRLTLRRPRQVSRL